MPSRCLAEVMRRVGCVFRRAVQFCNKRFDVFLVLQVACGFAVSIFWVLNYACRFSVAPTDL